MSDERNKQIDHLAYLAVMAQCVAHSMFDFVIDGVELLGAGTSELSARLVIDGEAFLIHPHETKQDMSTRVLKIGEIKGIKPRFPVEILLGEEK